MGRSRPEEGGQGTILNCDALIPKIYLIFDAVKKCNKITLKSLCRLGGKFLLSSQADGDRVSVRIPNAVKSI